jgi:hypothetical protein
MTLSENRKIGPLGVPFGTTWSRELIVIVVYNITIALLTDLSCMDYNLSVLLYLVPLASAM